MSKTWLITGASRGLGLELAKAALQAGERVAATGRRRAALVAALGADSDRLVSLELDVTEPGQASRAVETARARLGSIDVLVNNAGYGHLGFFEETTSADVQSQFATNLFGVFNVTRAVLPLMRAARSGRIFNLSSIAGIRGAELGSLYSASKFALEGFSESLAHEVAPFGIFVTIVEPGPFRTDFLSPESIRFSEGAVADYDSRREQLRTSFEQRDGRQPGDPAKLSAAMLRLSNEAQPPLRFLAGSFALHTADAKLAAMRSEFDRWRELALATDY
jgi:NAD(P)-dependent dehydrogenase (short-subunit alcohol dehydrogenase family)